MKAILIIVNEDGSSDVEWVGLGLDDVVNHLELNACNLRDMEPTERTSLEQVGHAENIVKLVREALDNEH